MQSEMKLIGGTDLETLRQHFGRKIIELEDEKRKVQVLPEIHTLNIYFEPKIKFMFPYIR